MGKIKSSSIYFLRKIFLRSVIKDEIGRFYITIFEVNFLQDHEIGMDEDFIQIKIQVWRTKKFEKKVEKSRVNKSTGIFT